MTWGLDSFWNVCSLFLQVIGIPRDCIKYKTKMSSRNALNPIWEETFELDIHLPDLVFLRFTVIDVTSNLTTAQRVVPVNRLKSGYRHLRLHNEMDQPLPLSQLFLCRYVRVCKLQIFLCIGNHISKESQSYHTFCTKSIDRQIG